MITIYTCNIYSTKLQEYGDYCDKFLLYHIVANKNSRVYQKNSKRSQWKYIKQVNKSNGVIATLPHEYSVLRSMFINKHLDE